MHLKLFIVIAYAPMPQQYTIFRERERERERETAQSLLRTVRGRRINPTSPPENEAVTNNTTQLDAFELFDADFQFWLVNVFIMLWAELTSETIKFQVFQVTNEILLIVTIPSTSSYWSPASM